MGLLLLAVLGLTASASGQGPGSDGVFIEQVRSSAVERLEADGELGAAVTLLTRACPGGAGAGTPCATAGATARAPTTDARNVATVEQIGTGHRLDVVQVGTGHFVRASVTGANNRLAIRQDGRRSTVRGLDFGGRNNTLTIRQLGSDLTYVDEFRFDGGGLEGSVRQEGSDLTLIQEGSWPTGFEIEQTGAGPGPGSAIRVVHVRGSIVTTPLSP